MELRKIITVGNTVVEDGRDTEYKIRLIDVTTTNSLLHYGEVRIDNSDFAYEGAFTKGAEITIDLSLGEDALTRIFTGVIIDVFEGEVIVLTVRGNGEKLKEKRVKKSLNRTTNSEVIRTILENADVEYELGRFETVKRHTYILANGTIAEELLRFNKSFGLRLFPFFNREGKLILKTYDENVVETDVEFEEQEYQRFENDILETVLDVEINLFDKIKILGDDYVVASHRFYLNEQRTRSVITISKA